MKNAVVTGHMNGMGKGAYELLKQKGYNVIGWDISGEGDEKVDVSSAKDVAEAAARLTEPIDAVVLCAGVWREMPLLETTDDDWNYLMNINAYGIFNCVRALVPHMHRDTAIAAISSPPVCAAYPLRPLTALRNSQSAVLPRRQPENWAPAVSVSTWSAPSTCALP